MQPQANVHPRANIDLFIDAISNSDSEALKMLLKDEQMIAELNNYGTVKKDTPLTFAVKQSDYEMTRLLIDKDADVTAPNASKKTPIFIASNNNNLKIVTILLEKMKENASLDQQDKFGMTALYVATCYNRHEIVKLLIERGANIIPQYTGWTPLHIAVKHNKFEIAKTLLERQQNHKWLNNRNCYGDTALHLAAENKNHEIIKLLLNSNAIVTSSNKEGNTPLHNVVKKPSCVDSIENLKTIKILLAKEKWLQSQLRNNDNQTALDIAVDNKQFEIVNYFLNNILIDVSKTTVLFNKLFEDLFKTNNMFDAKKQMISSFRRHGAVISEDQLKHLKKSGLIENLQVNSLQNMSRQVIKKYTSDNDIVQLPLPKSMQLSLKDQ